MLDNKLRSASNGATIGHAVAKHRIRCNAPASAAKVYATMWRLRSCRVVLIGSTPWTSR